MSLRRSRKISVCPRLPRPLTKVKAKGPALQPERERCDPRLVHSLHRIIDVVAHPAAVQYDRGLGKSCAQLRRREGLRRRSRDAPVRIVIAA
jgi:hypothetical protein